MMPLSRAVVPLRDADVPVFFFAVVVPAAAFDPEAVAVVLGVIAVEAVSTGAAVTAAGVDDAAAVVSALDCADGRHPTSANGITRAHASWDFVISYSPKLLASP